MRTRWNRLGHGLALLGLSAAAVAAGVPPPPAEPVTETLFGRTVTDEYRWMEDPAREPALREWVLAESAATVQSLAALPTHAAFAEGLRQVGGSLTRVHSVVIGRDGLLAFQRIRASDRVPQLVLRQGRRERVLIDPNQAASGSVVAINNHVLSPDGRHIAVHTATGGAEVGQITIYAVATGQPVGEPIGPVWGEFRLAWLDADTIAYTRMADATGQADPMQRMTAHVRALRATGTPPPVLGPDTPGAPVAPKDFPLIIATPISPWVAGLAVGARADMELFAVPRQALGTTPPPWRRVAGLADQVRAMALRGDTAYLLATRDNPHGRLARRTLGAPDDAPATTLFDGRPDLILESVEATDDGVYLQALTDGRARLFYSARGQQPLREVALPFEGSMVDFEASRDGRLLGFGLTGWLTNTRYFQVHRGRLKAIGLASDTWPGAAAFTVRRLQATSQDGTAVPLVVVHPRAPAPAGGYPALLEGYGSYGISTATPYYNRFAMAWVRQGGAMAYCGTRGGGERGRAWHDGGREANKPRAHQDLVACATTLRAQGLARAAGPVVTGTSAGGLLAPPAAMARPDVFAGLVARVAVTNPTRLAAAPNGANQFDEMGDPGTAVGWAALAAQDAYLLSATATDLPDTLLTIGLNDKRVAPWMSAKLAARAKLRFGDRRRVLLRADTDAGHGVGSAEAARQAERADIFAFAWQLASR